MARFRGSIVKKARNLGTTLDGYPKTENLRRNYPSGQHGQGRRKISEFGTQLREKQRVRFTYGLSEKQFRRYYDFCNRKEGVTGSLLLQRLETRLDNVVYRSGLAKTRPQARQLVVHGHLQVNGRKVDIPSYILKPGDVITVREKSKASVKANIEGNSPLIPSWIESDLEGLAVKFNAVPERQDLDPTIKENLIVEYYSR